LNVIKFTDADLIRLNEQYAYEDIPYHARPLRAAGDILGGEFSIGTFANPVVTEINTAYTRLFPEVSFTWPGMGTGITASIDRVKKVTIGAMYGRVSLTPSKALGFNSDQEWWDWCGRNVLVANRSAYAFADMFDLVQGIDDKRHSEDVTFWGLACDNLRILTESLSLSSAVSGVVLQPICLTAELAMKGTLLKLGVTEQELRDGKKFGHSLEKLAVCMTQKRSHRDDTLLLEAISRFPNYVQSRYNETSMTRLQVIGLALDAQFIAASSVRRMCTERDIALQLETTQPGPRANFFS